MSRKKSQTPKTFANNPFKDLKGLSVSDEREPAHKKPPREPRKKSQAAATTDDSTSFAEEMAWLGVQRLETEDDTQSEQRQTRSPVKPQRMVSAEQQDKTEEREFLSAIGQLDHTFQDQWPDDEDAVHQAKPRRMRLLQRGRLQPEAELDLHGMTCAEALHRVRYFVENAHHHGLQAVLVITGKGTRSAEGPVLKSAVIKRLSEMSELVLEWGDAPKRYGGSGALVVFLRQRTDAPAGQ